MIGLKLTVIQGSTVNQKTEFFFDHQHTYVVLGCDPQACDIVFEETHRDNGVGNEHIAFKRSLGRYQIDLNTDHFATIDGTPPFEDQEISGTSTLVLGNDVTIEIEVVDKRKPSAKIGKQHIQPGRQVQKQRTFLKVAFFAIALLGLGGFLLNNTMFKLEENVAVSQENINQTVEQFSQLSTELDRVEQLTDTITPDVIQKITESVYLVLVKNNEGGERPAGTAWVYSKKALATNAHVAQAFHTLKSNETLIVRSPIPPYKTHTVKNAFLHPGYYKFSELWRQYLPTQKVDSKLAIMHTAAPADVAVLTLENSQGLGEPIELLPLDELNQIRPGKKVAFVGYPSERLLPSSFKSPTPVVQQDEIIRVTDFFLTKQAHKNRLIHHGLPLTGGASGSPMFNSKGQVIGLISAMNISIDAKGRTPNAADVNIGQRIDFLYDLINGNIDNELALLEQQWTASLSTYFSARTESQSAIINKVKNIFNLGESTTTKVIEQRQKFAPSTSKYLYQKHTFDIKQPGIHLAILTAQGSISSLSVNALDNKNFSTYSYPIKYSNFALYRIIIANETGKINTSFKIKNDFQGERILPYKLQLVSWNKNINQLADGYIKNLGYVLTQKDNKFSLIKQAENLPMKSSIKGNYYTGFNYQLPQKGYYVFSSVPQNQGNLDIILLDEKNEIIKKDKSKNSIGLVLYENKQEKKQVKIFSMGVKGDIMQNISVYFMPYPSKA